MMAYFKDSSGQVIIEIIIAFLLLIFFALGLSGVVATSLRGIRGSSDKNVAVYLGEGYADALRAVALEDWHNISNLATTSAHVYYLRSNGNPIKWGAFSDTEGLSLNNLTYTRNFYVDDVYRSTSTGVIVTSGGYYDPSTKKATIQVFWTDTRGTSFTYTKVVYYSRYLNNLYTQTDWSGGSVGDASTSVTTTTFATSSAINSTGTTGSILLQLQ